MQAAASDKKNRTLLALELFGAPAFVYRQARLTSFSLLAARAYFVKNLLYEFLKELRQSLGNAGTVTVHDGLWRQIISIDSSLLQDAIRKSEELADSLNLALMQNYKNKLFLNLAWQICKQDSESNTQEALLELEEKLRVQRFKVFKNNLTDLFAKACTTPASQECDLCGEEAAALAETVLSDSRVLACPLCLSMLSEHFQQEEFAKKEEHPDSVLHVAINKMAEARLMGKLAPDRENTILEIVKSECKKISSIHREVAESLLILEANDDNILVFGKLPQTLDLAFAVSSRLDSLNAVSHAAGLRHTAQSLPLSILVRDALSLTLKAKSLGNKCFAIKFAGQKNEADACFSWAQWRKQVRPLMERIRHFDNLAVLGHGFWDFLLSFAQSGSSSIYRLMYRLARREEIYAILRKDPGWQAFKSDLLLSLAGDINEEKRRILKTSLTWFLFFKTKAHLQGSPQLPAFVERR